MYCIVDEEKKIISLKKRIAYYSATIQSVMMYGSTSKGNFKRIQNYRNIQHELYLVYQIQLEVPRFLKAGLDTIHWQVNNKAAVH